MEIVEIEIKGAERESIKRQMMDGRILRPHSVHGSSNSAPVYHTTGARQSDDVTALIGVAIFPIH